MSRFYVHYSFELLEPAILGNGSQLMNVLQTHSFVPGTTMRGLVETLYLRSHDGRDANNHFTPKYEKIFCSDDTHFSPAYPLVEGVDKAFPMPFSVFGCKYHGMNQHRERYRPMHGFQDYLWGDIIPDRCQKCGAPMEHKSSFCYFYSADSKIGFCDMETGKSIRQHNKVSQEKDDKRLFSYESLQEGQQFYGEISFCAEDYRNTVKDLLRTTAGASIGKARKQGYGKIKFLYAVPSDSSFRNMWRAEPVNTLSPKVFSLDLFSDTILVDRRLNPCTTLDAQTLAFWMGLPPDEVQHIQVHPKPDQKYRSFFKTQRVFGFNPQSRMPLSMEIAMSKGSVFTIEYTGAVDILPYLQRLQEEGLGLRRNEGFGMVIINHGIHGLPQRGTA